MEKAQQQKYGNDKALGQCIEIMREKDCFIVQCAKQRRSGSVDGLSLEQTQCVIEVIDSKTQEKESKAKMETMTWTSVHRRAFGRAGARHSQCSTDCQKYIGQAE